MADWEAGEFHSPIQLMQYLRKKNRLLKDAYHDNCMKYLLTNQSFINTLLEPQHISQATRIRCEKNLVRHRSLQMGYAQGYTMTHDQS